MEQAVSLKPITACPKIKVDDNACVCLSVAYSVQNVSLITDYNRTFRK